MEIQRIMSTEGGRAFMYRMLEQTGIFSTTYDDNPYTHARNTGRREAGIWLFNELQDAAFESYLRMLKEQRDDE